MKQAYFKTKEEHAREAIELLTNAFMNIYGQRYLDCGMGREEVKSMAAASLYRQLEREGILKPDPDIDKKNKAQFEAHSKNLQEKPKVKQNKETLEGQRARDFDRVYISAKEQVKNKTPLVVSTPDMPAKQTRIHKG